MSFRVGGVLSSFSFMIPVIINIIVRYENDFSMTNVSSEKRKETNPPITSRLVKSFHSFKRSKIPTVLEMINLNKFDSKYFHSVSRITKKSNSTFPKTPGQ